MVKELAVIMVWKLLKMSKSQQLTYIKANLKSKEFQELIYIGCHTSIAFRFKLPEALPRPQAPLDYHKTFYKLAMNSIKDSFNEDKRQVLKDFIETTDPLSQYIYAKIINKTLGLSRNDLEENIPGLIEKEPYELITPYGSPKMPCILQTYDKGIEAIVTVKGSTAVLKDKGGVAISGFEEHLEEFKLLKLQGTFNIVINGLNEEVFTEHVLGKITRLAAWEPVIIIDYQIDLSLSERLSIIEGALIEHSSALLKMAHSFKINSLEDTTYLVLDNKAVARQDIKPVLRKEGNHSIDVSFML